MSLVNTRKLMQKNPQRDVMEREGGICFKQNWFVPHLLRIFIPTLPTPMLLRRGLRDVYPRNHLARISFCPWRTPTKLSPRCLTCASGMPCFLCSLLYLLAIKHYYPFTSCSCLPHPRWISACRLFPGFACCECLSGFNHLPFWVNRKRRGT